MDNGSVSTPTSLIRIYNCTREENQSKSNQTQTNRKTQKTKQNTPQNKTINKKKKEKEKGNPNSPNVHNASDAS